MSFRVQMNGLNCGDVASLPHYRNLIPRFRGEENRRLRISTGYLNRGKRKFKIVAIEETFGSMVSLSFDRQAMKADMMLRSQGREGTSFDGGNFGAETDFSVWLEMPCTQSDRRKAGGCMRGSASS
jgi:hypothetical protein